MLEYSLYGAHHSPPSVAEILPAPGQTVETGLFELYFHEGENAVEVRRVYDLVTPLYLNVAIDDEIAEDTVVNALKKCRLDFAFNGEVYFSIPLALAIALRPPNVWFKREYPQRMMGVDLCFTMFMEGIKMIPLQYTKLTIHFISEKDVQEVLDNKILEHSIVVKGKRFIQEKRRHMAQSVHRDILQQVTLQNVESPDGAPRNEFRVRFHLSDVLKGFFIHAPEWAKITSLKLLLRESHPVLHYRNPFMFEDFCLQLPDGWFYYPLDPEKKHAFKETSRESFTNCVLATWVDDVALRVEFETPITQFQVYALQACLLESCDGKARMITLTN